MDDSPQSKPLLLPGAMQLLPCLQGLLHGRAPDCIMCMHCPSSCKRVTGQQGCRHVPCLHDRLVEDVPNEQQRPPLCPSACRGMLGRSLLHGRRAATHAANLHQASLPGMERLAMPGTTQPFRLSMELVQRDSRRSGSMCAIPEPA